MRIPRLAAVSQVLVTAALFTVPLACGGSKPTPAPSGKTEAKTSVAADDGKEDVVLPADGRPGPGGFMQGAEAGKATASGGPVGSGSGAAAAATEAAPATGGGTGGAATGGAPTGGPATGGATGAAETEGGTGGPATGGGESTGGPNWDALIKEVKRRRTKDERALAALAEAEELGAEAEELAEAANARGQYLHATPDRAKVFFEWAAEKNTKYAAPTFNLAKQAAVLGELEDAKKWLSETRKRNRGKRLLQQIDFDPMWEILKDDPDVRALLK